MLKIVQQDFTKFTKENMRIILSLGFCLFLALATFGQQSAGSTAQSFNAYTLDGKAVSLDEMRGKVVVMMFWSTKCAICHSEIPKLNRIAGKYAGQNVVFLGLTMNNEAIVNEYLKKRPFNFTIVPNGLGVLMQYADKDSAGRINMGFPSYFIINQTGQITQKSNGWDKVGKIDSEVNRLLSSRSANVE